MATESVPAKSPAKKTSPKKKAGTAAKPKKAAPAAVPTHPSYQEMIKEAVKSLKERNGSSRAAILKYILQNYTVGTELKKINAHLKHGLKKGVETGALKQVKGTGASGSFRLGESAAKKKSSHKKKTAPPSPNPSPRSRRRRRKPKRQNNMVYISGFPKKATTPKKTESLKKPKVADKKPKATPKKASPKKKTKTTKKAAPKKA